MSLLGRLLSGELRAGTPAPDDDYWYRPVGSKTAAGVPMDAEAAKKISAWYRGRDILATVVAMLPLPLLERLPNDGGARPARSHPLYDLLHDKPNAAQDSFQWRRQKMYHLIDFGNAYDWILPGMRGFVDQLEPIHPTRVTPERIKVGSSRGRMLYHIRAEGSGQTQTYTQDEVFHLRGASDDGVVGKGILEHARSSLGTAAATESYAANIFGRGTLNSGVIETPGLLDPDASKRMAASFVTAAGNWHLPKVLEQGAKWVESKLTPEDAQMLSSRKHTVDDIARWLGVPRQMLENSDPSFGNAEQFDQNFITYGIGPWLSLFEFAIGDQLVIAAGKYYAQFTRDAIVRGALAVRWSAHVAAVNAGIKSVDEVRAVENLNTRGGKADELRQPQNITGRPTAVSDPSAQALAESIVIEAAARLLRKEIAAVRKAAVRCAGDEEAFVEAVTTFYDKHAALVAQALQMPDSVARAYCANQAHQVVNGDWVAALERWEAPPYPAGIAALALDGAAA